MHDRFTAQLDLLFIGGKVFVCPVFDDYCLFVHPLLAHKLAMFICMPMTIGQRYVSTTEMITI
jgi:hypothetical protein